MNITIDGKALTAEPGESILDCALRNGIDIPHLCTHPCLTAFGACRMCLVSVEGMRGYPPSCTTPATEGMVVETKTEKLQELRRGILGMTMLEHPNACLVCGKRQECEEFRPVPEKAGRTTGCKTCNNKETCDVRVLAADLEMVSLPVPPRYHKRPLERGNPFIDRDLNLCILCGRCVRICKHLQGRSVIDFVGRSSKTQIGEAFGRNLVEAGCTFCGACVDVCPTGTISDRYAKWQGKQDLSSPTTCALCPEACAVKIGTAAGNAAGAEPFSEEQALCVLGRFCMPEFLNHPDRLVVPKIRVGQVLREVTWEDTLARSAEVLGAFEGNTFAFVCDDSSPLEARYLYKKFTTEVMQSKHYIELKADDKGIAQTTLPDGIEAAIVTGQFVDTAELAELDVVIILDAQPSKVQEMATVVMPTAVLAEAEGTLMDKDGTNRPLISSCKPKGESKQEWATAIALAEAMDADGFEFDSVAAVREAAGIKSGILALDRKDAPAPTRDFTLCPTHYRGHKLLNLVSGLRQLPGADIAPEEVMPAKPGTFPILRKEEVSPNNFEFVVQAPEVAKKAQAGQFAIVMVDETSERVPYTLCDWDAEAGTITFIIQEKGQSSRKFILCQEGDALHHVVGPLGIPFEVNNYGTVALAGGCYGVGAVYSIAKALREAGNKVIIITEARSHYIHYHTEKLGSVADEFIQTTIDGSNRVKGHAVDVLEERLKSGEEIDCIVAIGCPFMMKITSEMTKAFAVPTWSALNPIMVDGTGMCGACRITVGDETKFACVDGPFFDAHQVDWMEVRNRREAYSSEEIHSVALTEAVTDVQDGHPPGHHPKCGCHD